MKICTQTLMLTSFSFPYSPLPTPETTHTVCSCGENRARFHYPCLLLYLERGPRRRQQQEQRRGEGGREGRGRQSQHVCPTCRGPLYWEEMA